MKPLISYGTKNLSDDRFCFISAFKYVCTWCTVVPEWHVQALLQGPCLQEAYNIV